MARISEGVKSVLSGNKWHFELFVLASFLLYFMPFTKAAGTFLILLIIPGASIFSLFSKGRYNLFEFSLISSIIGLAYQVIISYYLSSVGMKFVDIFPLILISLIPAVLYREKNFLKTNQEEKIYLAIIITVILFSFFVQIPRSETASIAFNEIGPFPPGDDSKLHTMLVNEILYNKKIPSKISLYPEVNSIKYPMGYHAIISELSVLSGLNYFTLMFYSGQIMFSLLMLITYIAGKHIFSEKVGLYASILVAGSVSPFKFIILGGYPNFMAILVHIISILFLFHSLNDKKHLMLLGFLSAATFLINPYPFVFTFIISMVVLIHQKKNVLNYILPLVLFSIIYLPTVLGLNASTEHVTTVKKFYPTIDMFTEKTFAKGFADIMSFVNIDLIVLGLAGILFFDKEKHKVHKIIWCTYFFLLLLVFFKVFIVDTTILFPVSISEIVYSFHPLIFVYYILTEKVLYHMFIPAALSTGYLIFVLFKEKLAFPFMFIILISMLPVFLMYSQEGNYEYKYATLGDIEYAKFIKNSTEPDAIIFNDSPLGTPTTWIPILSERKITFPFLIFDPDLTRNLLKIDSLYKAKIVATAPDSKEAFDVLKEFNASYVAFSTFFNMLNIKWDEKKFFRSRCYEKLYGKNDLWLFKADMNCTYVNWMTLFNISNPPVNRVGKGMEIILDYSNLDIGPPITDIFEPYLYLRFNDSEDERDARLSYLTGIYGTKLYYTAGNLTQSVDVEFSNSKRVQLLIIPLNQEILKSKALKLFFTKETEIDSIEIKLHVPNSYEVDSVNLVGKWEKFGDYLLAPSYSVQSLAVIRNVSPGTLKISYLDDSTSNIDINIFDDGQWKQFGVLYRKNTGNIVTVEYPVNEPVPFIYLGIYPHYTFNLKSIEIDSARSP